MSKQISRRLIVAALSVLVLGGSVTAFALADTSSSGATQPADPPLVQQAPPKIAAEFPALRKAIDQSESEQLPTVARVMGTIESRGEAAASAGVNAELARRISEDGESAEYVVPGNEVVCMVAISAAHSAGGGCAPASSVEQDGSTSLTVVPGGYEVSGILPTGTSTVRITSASGQTTVVAADSNHAFEFFSAAPLAKLTYSLPEGGEHEGSLELPPPKDPPAPPAG
jgi:hypothetical protein